MQDIHILKILDTRSNFNKYSTFIKLPSLNKYARQVYKDMTSWYKDNLDVEFIDWEGFSEWFRVVQHPTYETDLLDLYSALFERLNGLKDQDKTCDLIIKGFIDREYASRMVEFLMEVVEGRQPAQEFKQIQQFLTAYDSAVGRVTEQEESLIDAPIEELLASVTGGSGYNWRLQELNISLGPLRPKNSILVAAYPDSGKTTFAVSEMTYMINQMEEGKECLYFCNEEYGGQNKVRCVQALVGASQEELQTNTVAVATRYKEYCRTHGERFKFYHNTHMTTRFIEETIKQHNPGLIIIDQLWNVEGFADAGTSTEMYTALSRWVRRIASSAPCISIHQADGTASGVKFIEMHQLHGSKVGMQGAFDAIITIGRPFGTDIDSRERGLYVPKNKLPGGPAPYDSKQKHQKWTVFIDHDYALYRGMADSRGDVI